MESITTRAANASSAADVGANGFEAADAVSTAKTITLDKWVHVTHAFSMKEIADNGLNLLRRTFIEPAAYGIVNRVLDDVFAQVTAANYSSSSAIDSSSWNADSVVDVAKTLSEAGVPRQDRTLLVNPTYFAQLAKDDAIQNSAAYGGNDVVRDNSIGTVHGLGVVEYADLPHNDENLFGMGLHKSAILIGSRLPDTANDGSVNVENVIDPDTGFGFQLREWTENKEAKVYITACAMYGTAIGNAAALHRVTSA